MKSFLIILTAILMLLLSCTGMNNEDGKFERLANSYIDSFLEHSPEWATSLGDHRYDGRLDDYSKDAMEEDLRLNRGWLDSLGQVDASKLNETNRIDYQILLNHVRYSIFSADSLRRYEKNPLDYNPGGAIYQLLAHDFAPLEERLINVKMRLGAIPKRLTDARANLKNPPEIFTETAIEQIDGTISYIKDGLKGYLEQLPDLAESIKPVQEAAVKELEDYRKWLETDLLPSSQGDFRLGRELYDAKFGYAMSSDITPEEILERAEADLKFTHSQMFKTATPLFKKYFSNDMYDATFTNEDKVIKMVLDKMADDHPTADNIIELAEQKLRECENFVREKQLVTIFGDPIEIIVMPEFERGVAVAYCSSPGPLEKKGETFYAIAPPPSSWDAKRVESYFREYNNYMLTDLTIHEAMPGHYLQATHANRFRAPTMVRSIFGSGTFVEGWATYCEQLMVEQGFGGEELRLQMLKMRLRMLINVILDQKIHTAGMTEDEAMDLMVNRGFQEDGEAAGKWRRACLSSVQLTTYYVGNIAINDIRKEYQEEMGESFNIKKFHDRMLSFGAPPPKYLKELLRLS